MGFMVGLFLDQRNPTIPGKVCMLFGEGLFRYFWVALNSFLGFAALDFSCFRVNL